MPQRLFRALTSAGTACLLILHFSAAAQDLVRNRGGEQKTVTLTGDRHPLARPEFDAGPASPDFRMQNMILVFKTPADQNAALEALMEAQHDPASPQFHRWLTPEDFAQQFGVSRSDLQRVNDWLTSQGFTIDEVPAGGRSIVFSGTASQVEAAFHTPIRTYRVKGEVHHANSADPQIPEALAGVVAGAVSLHDFRKAPMHSAVQAVPEYSSGASHYLSPGDFATIYDVSAVYTSGFTGSGQSIAIAGRTNIRMADVQAFRAQYGLPANNPVVVVNGTDPGIVSFNEEAEADLDVEWSGAVAPQATVKFVVSASTGTTDGIDLSAQYIVSHNLAPVLSVSFGACEAGIGSAERSFYNNLWQQAAAQGITALVSSGDNGAAGCDSASASSASGGQAVNGLCSTPYSVCVGGTEFNEGGNYSLYWSKSNNANGSSTLSYIPEVAWNESGSNGGSGLWATGGGASAYYSKPSWQSGPGVPADSKRDVPDIALAAGAHDGYMVNIQGTYYIVSGTSAASPSFGGIVALLNQKTGSRQGNLNTVLYPLAALTGSGKTPVFHSITGGNNTVPGVTGFSAGPYYNQATGLGSPDALLLLNHWSDTSAAPPSATFAMSAPGSLSIVQGGSGTSPVTIAVSGGFKAAISLSATGLPYGVTAAFAPATLGAPGSGSSTLTISAASSALAGAYSVMITASSGSQTKSAMFTLTISPPFTVSLNPSSISIPAGTSGVITIATQAAGGFSSALALSVPKMPLAGVSAAFSPASIAAPGNGTSKLTLSVASNATPGGYSFGIAATSGSTSVLVPVTVTITAPVAPASFTLSASPSTVALARGGGNSTLISLTPVNGFKGVATVSYSALPAGITARWSNVAAGAMLSFQDGTAMPGSYPITISGTSPGVSPSPTVTVTLNITK